VTAALFAPAAGAGAVARSGRPSRVVRCGLVALALFGPRAGLPTPFSGHLSFQFWHPAQMPERAVLLVGFDPGDQFRAHGGGGIGDRRPQ